MVWLDSICHASDVCYAFREEDICCSYLGAIQVGYLQKIKPFERLQFALCAFVNGRGVGEAEIEGITIPRDARQQDETDDKRLWWVRGG